VQLRRLMSFISLKTCGKASQILRASKQRYRSGHVPTISDLEKLHDMEDNVVHQELDREIGANGVLPDVAQKLKHFPAAPDSNTSKLYLKGSQEYKRRQYMATALIRTYGVGPRHFEHLVSKVPDILGPKYGPAGVLEPKDWRYCD